MPELVVAANRDEFFHRPTACAHYWQDEPKIFGGRDLLAEGTWLAVSTDGRFGVVTNWSDKEIEVTPERSRGDLIWNFLRGDKPAGEFIEEVEWHKYQGVNLILYDQSGLFYANNRELDMREMGPGYYGITNTHIDDHWERAMYGIHMLKQIDVESSVEPLLHMLRHEDEGLGGEVQAHARSSCFILGESYGTRSSTALIFSGSRVHFCEQSWGPLGVQQGRVDEFIELQGTD